MIGKSERQWWPFDIAVGTEQTTEMKAKTAFLNNVLRPGIRPFLQHDDLEIGAIADNGRECLIVSRGKQRAEAILTDQGVIRLKKGFSAAGEFEAFGMAAAVAIKWLDDGVIHGEVL